MSLLRLSLRKKRSSAPPPVGQGVAPPLKIPQHTTTSSNLSYRSAPATEFRESIGVGCSFVDSGALTRVAAPAPPGSGFTTMGEFWRNELQYLGIRQLRGTPTTNDNPSIQWCKDWANFNVGYGTGKLCIEPGYIVNDPAQSRNCTGVTASNAYRTIDFVMELFLSDANLRKAVNIIELLNEPDNFQCNKFVLGPATTRHPQGICDEYVTDVNGWTWLECVGEYNKKVYEKYIINDSRCLGMQTVASCPAGDLYMIDSEFSNTLPDDADVFRQWGSVLPYTQFGNNHPYCGFTRPGHTFCYNTTHGQSSIPGEGWPGMLRGKGAWPTLRMMPTEFGYVIARPGTTANWACLPNFRTYANYQLKTYLEAFIRGYERVYWFNLDPPNASGALPRVVNGGPDDFSMYTWTWDGVAGHAHSQPVRTQAVDAMHRFTQTIGEGTNQPNVSWSMQSPATDLRWVMLRRSDDKHVLIMWRYVHEVQQTGVALGSHDVSKPPPADVTVTPTNHHVNLPTATTVTLVDPLDGNADVDVTIAGSGSTRGVDVSLAEKPMMLVIDTSSGPVDPNEAFRPIVVPASGSTAATLRTGSVNGPRLHLKGINIWGLPDNTTANSGVLVSGVKFYLNQYTNRVAICNTIQGWGANCVRLRAQASAYNGAPSADTDSLTKTQILDRIEDWRDAIVAENMYLCICTWDGLDGPYAGANLPAQYTNIFQFYTDVFARLGNDPMVFYEFTNEPNNIDFAQWQTIMHGAVDHFRDTMGYMGVLVINPPNWAASGPDNTSDGQVGVVGYNNGFWSELEQYDGSKTGLGGKHQIVFAKHDYANNYPSNTFNLTNWQNAVDGPNITHLVWENEFGNFNAGGPDPDTDDTWSSQMAAAARDQFAAKQNYVGAAPFLFGPWSDLNRITKNASDSGGPSNSDPKSPWGITVRDTYFGTSTPPAVAFTPGIVLNGSTSFDTDALTAADSLNPQVVRQEIDFNRNVASAGADRTFLDNIFTQYADNGIRILPLANGTFDGTNPTGTHATNIATWATRYGPGGAFWTAYAGTDRPITHIEYGNEVSYSGNAANGGDAAYQAKAQHYATSFVTTRNAVKAANASVGLLAIGDAAGNAFWSSWIDQMYVAVSNLSSQVDGWTVHPYGPGGPQKLQRVVDLMAGKGAPSSIPIDITEIGVASCNNNHPLPDGTDYGDGRTLTYSQAATALQNETSAIRTNANWGSRVRHFMIYQAHDNQPVGSTGGPADSLEGYYGGLTSTLAEKGAFSTAVRTILAS